MKQAWARQGVGGKWAQGLREGPSLQVRRGEARRSYTRGARFQPPVEPAAGERPGARAQEGAPRR